MTDYSKMTKAELIYIIKNIDSCLAYERDMAKVLADAHAALEAENIALRNSRPNMPSGWWIGVALFAAILIPWVFFAMWVMG